MSIDIEKNTFMIKALIDRGIKQNFFSLIKDIYEKPTVNVIPNGEKTEYFPLQTVNIIKDCPLSLYLLKFGWGF